MRATPILLVLLLGPLLASAEGASLEDLRRARALSADLMSPYCPGRTLADCPSPDAGAVNDQIRAWVSSGLSDEQIRAELRQRFGDRIDGGPGSLLGWALPAVLLIGGAAALVVTLRRMRPDAPEDSPLPPPDPELLAELERD